MIKKLFLKSNNVDNQKGLAILYAVIVSIIMLSVATSISSIALRQTKLSSTGRESQYAFFAANTGIECARYWDLQTFDDGSVAFSSNDYTPPTMKCNEQIITISQQRFGGYAINSFDFSLTPDLVDLSREYLIQVQVKKTATSTLITSRGYNTKTADAPNAVQRGLEMFYGY